MQKVKTHEYEFLARLLSPVPLYEFRWREHICVTGNPVLEKYLKDCYHNKPTKELYERFDFLYAHTSRSVWKKVCKRLNNGTN